MFMNCKHALRHANRIQFRPAFNHLNRSISPILSANSILSTSPILTTNQRYRDLHQTHRLQRLDFIHNALYDLSMKIKSFTYSGSQLQEASVCLLEMAIDQIDHLEWFECERESEYLKTQLVSRMWDDFSARMNKLGLFPRKQKNDFILECHSAFNTSLIAYDEGLMGSDRELAAALWRTFFEYDCKNYTKLEVLVEYVRAQIQHLCSLKDENFRYDNKQLQWKTFNFPK